MRSILKTTARGVWRLLALWRHQPHLLLVTRHRLTGELEDHHLTCRTLRRAQ